MNIEDPKPIITTWHAQITKNNGQRRQFVWWKVPASIVVAYGLSDGNRYKVTIQMAASADILPEVIGTYDLLLTSGNELYLPADARKAIQARADVEPGSLVYFEMTVFASLESIDNDLIRRVQQSLNDPAEERRRRLASAETMPQRVRAWINAFRRNPDVVAEVLSQADGVCQSCGANAPFLKIVDDKPYLEVHHKIPLADGGKDTVQNAIALCPNCHRRQHHGSPDLA